MTSTPQSQVCARFEFKLIAPKYQDLVQFLVERALKLDNCVQSQLADPVPKK